MSLPLAGQIAAGSPLLAVEDDRTGRLRAAVRRRGSHFCLRVKGDSMIEDQIADGDYVVVRKTNRERRRHRRGNRRR